MNFRTATASPIFSSATADEVLVIKDGKVVEFGTADHVFENPETAYTKALMAAAFELAVAEGGAVSQ